MFRTLVFPESPGPRASVGLLALRVVSGAAFMFHGWGKIQNPFHWMDGWGNMPGILQAAAALAEFGGGACWILGALFPLASAGLACTMAVAAWKHFSNGDPFVANKLAPAYEPATLYLAIALLFLLVGPGSFAVDRFIFRKKDK